MEEKLRPLYRGCTHSIGPLRPKYREICKKTIKHVFVFPGSAFFPERNKLFDDCWSIGL